MLPGIVFVTATGFAAGLALTMLARRLRPDGTGLINRIDECLPQTQCAQCGYPGCRPYAAAIAAGTAPINRCPPGGDATITALANLLGRNVTSLDPEFGTPPPAQIALIDEAACIGCARCLDACPVDAIVGAHSYVHTVLPKLCTGCELCLVPCPVDCIALVPPTTVSTIN